MKRFGFKSGIGLLALSVGLLAACTTSSGELQGGEKSQSPAPSEGKPHPSDGLDLTISEKGFTASSDSGSDPTVNYAAFINNESKDAAVDIKVKVRFLDEGGDPIIDKGAGEDTLTTEIYSIAPGEKQPVTGVSHMEEDGTDSLEVKVESAKWYPGHDKRFRPMSVSKPEATMDDKKIFLNFTVTSPYNEDVPTNKTRAVFRDKSGDIIGGSLASDASDSNYVPGENMTTIKMFRGMPTGIDTSSIEVYVTHEVKG